MGAGGTSPKVVALLGVSGSGKNVVARRLLELGYQRVRFMDPIRDMLRVGFGLTEDEMDGPARSKVQTRLGKVTPQRLFNSLAHDWSRGLVHNSLLVSEWNRRIDLLPEDLVLTDDLSRPEEVSAIRARGGLIVRVMRPGHIPANAGSLKRQAVIAHDVQIINDGNREQLLAKADLFAAELARAVASKVA